jgi:lipopolysaccharide export system protein LptA
VDLDGPQVTATGKVTSTLQPATKETTNDAKIPSMLKKNEDVHVTAGKLFYDGRASKATYSDNASLWQGETKIKAATSIVIDDKSGDLSATGGVTTNAMILQEGADKKQERLPSRGAAKEFTYKEAQRLATYAGEASLVDRAGDLKATTIELYLKASGDEIERVEAHQHVVVTLVEKGRTATGDEMKYFAGDERYEMTGQPVTIVDECGRKNTGLTLTFFRATDRILLDGGPQNLTQTKSDGSSCR